MTSKFFITGATGQLGAFISKILMEQGHELYLLVRGKNGGQRIRKIFAKIGVTSQDYKIISGDLFGPCPDINDVDVFLHCAADLSFDKSDKDRVWHTNLDGTKNMLNWAGQMNAKSFQYVSTAYIAGKYKKIFKEQDIDLGQEFNNEYEASKMATEKQCHEFCRSHKIPLKIYRPSIVMGTSGGRTLHYKGYYVFLKVIANLKAKYIKKEDKKVGIFADKGILHLPIRIEAEDMGRKHLVALDYVGKAIAALSTDKTVSNETVFLLPDKVPTNYDTLNWTRQALNISDLSLVPFDSLSKTNCNRLERLLIRYLDIYRPYLKHEPLFDYSYSVNRIQSLGIEPCNIDGNYFKNLVEYGIQDNWGNVTTKKETHTDNYPYFEEFLPKFLNKEMVPGLSSIKSDFAVMFEDNQNYFWKLKVVYGKLKQLDYVSSKTKVDFFYKLSLPIFNSIIAGKRDPRHAFFAGKTNIIGDMEHGLKTATMLREFFKLHSYKAE